VTDNGQTDRWKDRHANDVNNFTRCKTDDSYITGLCIASGRPIVMKVQAAGESKFDDF